MKPSDITNMDKAELLEMPRTDFLRFRDDNQLRIFETTSTLVQDNGGNLITATIEYFVSPDGKFYKIIDMPRQMHDLKYRKDTLEGDIERLKVNIKILIKAIAAGVAHGEIERDVLKLKHPVSCITKRLAKKEEDQKVVEKQCIALLKQHLQEAISAIAPASNFDETYYVIEILSAEELRRDGSCEIITALMQLYQTYTDNESENE